jgi:hypothetical protein
MEKWIMNTVPPFPQDTHPVPVAIATRKAVHGVIMGFIVPF